MYRSYHTYAIAGIISCIHVEYVAFTAYHPENHIGEQEETP